MGFSWGEKVETKEEKTEISRFASVSLCVPFVVDENVMAFPFSCFWTLGMTMLFPCLFATLEDIYLLLFFLFKYSIYLFFFFSSISTFLIILIMILFLVLAGLTK